MTRHRPVDRTERREALLGAAIEGIRKYGPGVSMDRLAAEAGISKPILYRHFGDRAGLISAIAHQFAADLERELNAALGRAGASERDLLVGTIDAFLSRVETDPAVYRFLARSYPEMSDEVSGFLEQISSSVAVVIGERARALGRDSGGAEVIAHGIVSFVDAAGFWWASRRTMPRQQLVTYIADFLWSGFEGQGARA